MEQTEFSGRFRNFTIEMPEVIARVPGIRVFGRVLKSFIFSTDIALLMNTNADAVMAVYPFSSLHAISEALIRYVPAPVFCGIGGMNNIPEERLLDMARQAEYAGAAGVVTNSSVRGETISKLQQTVDIPLVVTVVSMKDDIERKLESGADIFNVSGAEDTCRIIELIKNKYPYVPVIATGGPTDETILETIHCGADAISFTPPTNAEIFKKQMQIFRENL